jgi:hypothetical protein
VWTINKEQTNSPINTIFMLLLPKSNERIPLKYKLYWMFFAIEPVFGTAELPAISAC